MRIRLFSQPFWSAQSGVPLPPFSLFINFVNAANGQLGTRLAEFDSPNSTPLPPNIMGKPLAPNEIFTVTGASGNTLQSGDNVQLQTNVKRFVGIVHDEENREDRLFAGFTDPSFNTTFVVNVLDSTALNQSLTNLDPVGPSTLVTFQGPGGYFLSFGTPNAPWMGISLYADYAQQFAVDYLPSPPKPHVRPAPKHRRKKH